MSAAALAGGWVVQRATGGAGELRRARTMADPLVRAVHVLDVERPALVLGSAQPDGVADRAACAAVGIDMVRRRQQYR